MKHIALFFTTLERGGTEHQAMLLAKEADKRYKLFAYAMRGGPLETELAKLKIPVRILHSTAYSLPRDIATLRSWLQRDEIDVLHCLLWHPNIIGRLACTGLETKCINSIRWAERTQRDKVDFATRPLVNHWIANSEHGAEIAKLPKYKTTIIANGIPDEILKTPLSAWKPKKKTAIMIGQFRREKQYDVLIRTAKLLPDWHFDLVGDGPLLDEHKALAKKIGADNVSFLGHRSDASKLLTRYNVSILLSKSEGNPNVTIESLGRGVPFIGSDIPAHRTILADHRGIIVRSEPKAVSFVITKIASMDKKQLTAMRKRGQKYIRENYNTQRMVRETQKVWDKVCA